MGEIRRTIGEWRHRKMDWRTLHCCRKGGRKEGYRRKQRKKGVRSGRKGERKLGNKESKEGKKGKRKRVKTDGKK